MAVNISSSGGGFLLNDIAATDTTFQLTAGSLQGLIAPFFMTIHDGSTSNAVGQQVPRENIKVLAIAPNDVITNCERGVDAGIDGTPAGNWAAGSQVLPTVSAPLLRTFIQLDSVEWLNSTKGQLINVQVFPAAVSAATYTPTVGTASIVVEVVGGGGGSDGIPEVGVGQNGISAGAGAGAYAKVRFTDSALFYPSVPVQVGIGGAAGTGGVSVGGNGGASSFGTLIQCEGGRGGAFSIVASVFPASTTLTLDTNPPIINDGVVIGSSAGVGAESAIIYAEEVANTLRGGKSSFAGDAGDGGDGLFSYASVLTPAVDGDAGHGGVIVVYEYS